MQFSNPAMATGIRDAVNNHNILEIISLFFKAYIFQKLKRVAAYIFLVLECKDNKKNEKC